MNNPATPPAGPIDRVVRFWFTATDPTTLGMMRIITGLVVLYVHAVYSLDFQAFFGKQSWYGQRYVDRERHEMPWMIPPAFGPEAWNEYVPAAHVPQQSHRREAFMAFVRNLPETKADRAAKFQFVTRLQKLGNVVPLIEGLTYVRDLPTDDRARAVRLDAMVTASTRTAIDKIPGYFDTLPPEGAAESRTAVRADIEAFFTILPKDTDARRYVLDHMLETSFPNFQALMVFLLELPDDAVKRQELLDYLDFWNTEARKAVWVGNTTFSIWFHITDPTEMAIAHAGVLLIILLFTLGVCTRTTSILTWLAAVSYIHRTQQVLFGMDTMMNILLLYLMVGNSGAALSVDRWWSRYRAAKRSLAATGTIDATTQAFLAKPPASVSAGFALRLTQVHFCIIYLAAGMSKLKGATWWNTNAYWDTVANPEFTLIHFEWYESLLRGLVSERAFFAAAAAGGVAFTFIMELGLPFLVWTRLRPYVIIGGVLFHFGIAIFMGLNLFGMLMMTLLLSYMPGCAIREILFGVPSTEKLQLRVRPTDPAAVRAGAIAVASDTEERITCTPTTTGSAFEVVGTTDPPANVLLKTVGLYKPVAWLTLIPIVGRKLRERIAPTH